MERRSSFKSFFVGLYFIALGIYLIVGLQPAEATNHRVSNQLKIPAINLISDVATLEVENSKLNTPDTIVGSFKQSQNKTLLIGHSSTVFQNLKFIKYQDQIIYNNTIYTVKSITVKPKSEINMNQILESSETDTLIIMTCAGQNLGEGDYTHRLIIEASVI